MAAAAQCGGDRAGVGVDFAVEEGDVVIVGDAVNLDEGLVDNGSW
jgi:hypothetical protein